MYCMKNILFIFTLFALSACVPAAQAPTVTNDSVSAPGVSNEGSGPSEAIEEAPHSVSLPALMKKDIIGSDFEIGPVLADNESYTRYYITYKSGDVKISGIMNKPKGEGPFPLLVLNHGYIDPAIYTNGRGLKREQDYLARRGYVVIHPDYRNHADSDKVENAELRFRFGYVEDVIAAVKAAGEVDFIDTTRVGMLGHSMGGGVTINTIVVDPDLIDAAVLFAPVSADQRRNFDKWTRSRTETAQEVLETYGTPTTSPEFWDNVSAYNFFDRIQVPIMNHHGTVDESVPLSWSDELEGWLNDAGKDLTYYVYEGEPHEFINAWPLVMSRTVAFFDEYVK